MLSSLWSLDIPATLLAVIPENIRPVCCPENKRGDMSTERVDDRTRCSFNGNGCSKETVIAMLFMVQTEEKKNGHESA
jgi:hypothetical protein